MYPTFTENQARATSSDNPSKTILIVEDSPAQTELLRHALTNAGYRVLAAANGAQGLALVKAQHPDAVVSDINMPVMNGYAMCEAIRSEVPQINMPVILLTMLSAPQDVIRGINVGADAYITKPYNIAGLLARIEALLAHPTEPSPSPERRKIEVRIADQTYLVDAHSPRILNLLISTYENSVLQNHELRATQQRLEDLNLRLEQRVREQSTALEASEHRFRALLEQASDLVLVANANAVITYVSPSIQRITGYQVAQVIGQSFLELTHRDDRRVATAGFAKLLEQPAETQFSELRFRHQDGRWLTFESIAKNALDDPAIKGIVINTRDITERNRADQALRESEVQFRGLVEQSIAGIYIIQDDKFAYVNPRFAEIRGFADADNIVGCDALSLVADKDRETVTEIQRQLVAGETYSASYSFTALCQDGSGIEVGANSSYTSYRGRPAIIGLLQDISEKKRAEEKIQNYLQQLESAFMSTVEVATNLSELRDPYTAGHERRVAELAVAIASELGLSARQQEGLRVAGLLHDVGKITIPSEILSKPGRLSAIEYQLIKEHARASYNVLKKVEFPWPVAEVALQHHERIDGSGYPQGLKGDAILFEARILAVADVVEAMASYRPYRQALGITQALAEIERGRGSIYDANVADACLKLFRDKGYALPV